MKSVLKRDGKNVSFDSTKIANAVERCLINGLHSPSSIAATIADHITRSVVNIAKNHHGDLGVEDIQRYVIQQLWAQGHFEAAEHYQNYREERARLRLQAPLDQEVVERVLQDQKHFPSDLQYYQFMGKFSRWREQDRRRETWYETCYERVLPWLFKQELVEGKLTSEEMDELGSAMYNLEVSPAMRVVQMAGLALDRCHIGVYNCAYAPIVDLFSIAELLYILMQGTGIGYSCESEYISELPRIKRQRGGNKELIIVPDTTEGWCDSYHRALQLWFDGYDVEFDVSGVRKRNARLLTKGGRAGGPEPFMELMTFARNLILARQGRYLEDSDVHRLCCFTGRIVQVGGVRRASEISLSDLNSQSIRNIKHGQWWADSQFWVDGKYLSMANNSAVYNERPTIDQFMDEWTALVKSKSGERGIFNREAAIINRPKRRQKWKFGVNPCGEILLREWGLCNLTIAVSRYNDTVESLTRKVHLATIFGVIQSTCTNFNYVRKEWKDNCEEERLLGVDITGHADCPLLRYGAPKRGELLALLKEEVAKTRKEFARRFGINESAADTCIKPGGDSSVFFDCGSGITDRYAAYQIRWVRESKDSPVARFLIDSGVPHAEAPEDKGLLVFGFPRQAPEGSSVRNDHNALDQLEMWLETKKNWAEHSVSCTVYVEDHEWLEVGAWVFKPEHWNHITGLSFLPKDNGTYSYAPNEELTPEKYQEFVSNFPKLNWAKLQRYELEDCTESAQTYACVGENCSI